MSDMSLASTTGVVDHSSAETSALEDIAYFGSCKSVESEAVRSRRPHRKSRRGCRNCKVRRVKVRLPVKFPRLSWEL